MEFVKFAMDDGYTQTLAIAPEGKFPVRRGNGDNPTAKFIRTPGPNCRSASTARPRWVSFYEQAMIDEIVGGLDVAQRWGVAEGQLSLASKMINSQAINRIVRQYIDDERRCRRRRCGDERRAGQGRVK